jgi:hypothetical protein
VSSSSPVADRDAGPALRAAATIGPYFAWEPGGGEPGWRPLSDLWDPDMVAERVGVARDTLGRMSGLALSQIGEREVASITFLGLASRLLSPLLAAATVGGAVPVPVRDRLWWRPVPGGPVPFAYQELTAADCTGWEAAAIAEVLTADAVCALVEPLLEVYGRRFSVSAQVLWGNVASALGGAAGMLADTGGGHGRRAASVVAEMLARPPLRGTAELIRPAPDRERWFLVRNNCCLYYRIPGGGTCGDCVLTPETERRRQWQAALSRR